jgi:Ser/Thr protein kinase RdoA (MazF antagonist)
MTPAVTRRTNAGLDWEIDLLGHLAAHGFRAPAIIPSLDGRHIDGIVVQRWLAVFKPPFVQP